MNTHTDMASSAWDQWKHLHSTSNQRDRYSLIQVVAIERSVLQVVGDESPIHKVMGLTVNVSSGGFCILVDWLPRLGEIFRIHIPWSTVGAKTPTLADVRWVKCLPFEDTRLVMVGMKFIV